MYLALFIQSVDASCADGLTIPTDSEQLTFGANDHGSCDTHLQSLETDTCTLTWIGGITHSKTIANSDFPTSGCYEQPKGYITQFNAGTI